MTRKITLTLLLALLLAAANAQPRPHRVKVEWGAVYGLNITDFSTGTKQADVRNKLGWQVGIVTAIDWGAVALEPQILYVRQGLRIRPDEGHEVNLKSNSVDVPVLASLRLLRPVRLYAGPVFTVVNNVRQKSGGDLLDFSRVRPSLSYAAGVGVALGRHMLVDLRYNGQLRAKHDVVLPDGGNLDKLRANSVALSFGYLF